jgi:hypothetical protein
MAAFPPQVEQWRAPVDRFASGTLVDGQTDFVLQWINEESNGSLCSTGIPGVEAGIFQLDTRAGADAQYASFADLMGPCQRGARLATDLTDDEMQVQVGSGIAKISDAVAFAQSILDSAGVSWSGSDFGSAVKQVHASPCVLHLLPTIVAQQGSPASWDDFTEAVMALPLSQMGGCAGLASSASKHGLRNRLEDTMRNAALAGAFWTGGVGAVLNLVKNPWVQLALGAFVVWGAWKLWGQPHAHANPARRRRRMTRRARRPRVLRR